MCRCEVKMGDLQIENHTENDRDMGDEKEEIGQVPFTSADGHGWDVLGHMQSEVKG
jgi:hypothetical protein